MNFCLSIWHQQPHKSPSLRVVAVLFMLCSPSYSYKRSMVNSQMAQTSPRGKKLPLPKPWLFCKYSKEHFISLFFTIHYFYVPTWRKPATWTHRSGEDFTGVALLLLWKKGKSLLLCDVVHGFSSYWKHWPEFEKWPWEVWTEKEFTQTWNEWPGLLQLFVPTHFT